MRLFSIDEVGRGAGVDAGLGAGCSSTVGQARVV